MSVSVLQGIRSIHGWYLSLTQQAATKQAFVKQRFRGISAQGRHCKVSRPPPPPALAVRLSFGAERHERRPKR